MKKIIIGITLLITLLPTIIYAEDLNLSPQAKSAILIEASTGQIIFEKNSDEKLNPASMTKMMSMLLIMENIEKGVINWDEQVTASENASSMGGSQILLETNEQMSVYDLFKGIAVASGNDAVVALAEKIAGTEEIFVEMMNKKAQELNLTNTNFKNVHGLDESNHYSSARDMSIIARELIKHEKVFEFTSIYEDYLRQNTDRKLWLVNTNKLVKFYPGVDGLKTGFTQDAGYCLTATAKKNNMRIIAVVMGEPDSTTRTKEVTEMLDYAFAQYKIEYFLSTNNSIKTEPINLGKKETVEIVPKEEVSYLYKKIDERITPTYNIKIDKLTAPINAGDNVGSLEIYINDSLYKTVDLTVQNTVEKAGLFNLYLRYLKNIITGRISI